MSFVDTQQTVNRTVCKPRAHVPAAASRLRGLLNVHFKEMLNVRYWPEADVRIQLQVIFVKA